MLSQISDSTLNKRFHIIAPNRPGYAPWDHGHGDITLEGQARVSMGLAAMNKSGMKPVIVGHSLGGPGACRMAMDYPDKVGGVVVVAGSTDPGMEKKRMIPSAVCHMADQPDRFRSADRRQWGIVPARKRIRCDAAYVG